MDEFSFIRSIQPKHYRQPSLVKGIEDDAAVFRPQGHDVVTAVDTMVEGVHFTRDTMSPKDIGYRALAANLSDLAAMGSQPAFYLVSLVVPSDWNQEELEDIYKGMKELADNYEVDLIGGDTVGGQQLTVSITVIGYTPYEKARYRSSAEPSDMVFVTGTLGDSRAGLECLLNKTESARLIKRHQRPEPRVEFAIELQSLERVSLNDVSDGIANEANEIAEASRVDVHLVMEDLPHSEEIKSLFPDDYKEWMLSGGEDFELLGTVNPEDWSIVQEAAERSGIAVTQIGHVTATENEPAVYISEQGRERRLSKTGFTHLKKGEES